MKDRGEAAAVFELPTSNPRVDELANPSSKPCTRGFGCSMAKHAPQRL